MNTKGILLIVTGTVLWGTSGVISQHLFTDKMFTAEWFVTARLISSGIILLIIDALLHKGDIFSIWLTKDKWALIIFGIFGMLGVQYTYFGTIVHSNAATATILQYLMPIFIELLKELAIVSQKWQTHLSVTWSAMSLVLLTSQLLFSPHMIEY